jgi:lipooligosaccharide transport system permease protein
VSATTSRPVRDDGTSGGQNADLDGTAGRARALGVTPMLALPSRRALHLIERNMLVYRRGWIFIVSGFFEPFFYLLSLGVGLNKLVGPLYIGSKAVSYTEFVAPGLLATSAMNGAVFDSTFNVFFKLKIAKTYDTVLATPLGVGDVATGEITWALMRGTIYATAFICVMAALGLILSPWAVLCLPAAMLTSFAFAGIGMAATSYMRSWQDFDLVALALLPLFLFSATFYPLSVYPGWLQLVVRVTPLYQSVALIRSLDAGQFSWALLGHAAYLAALGLFGLRVTAGRLAKLLLP